MELSHNPPHPEEGLQARLEGCTARQIFSGGSTPSGTGTWKTLSVNEISE